MKNITYSFDDILTLDIKEDIQSLNSPNLLIQVFCAKPLIEEIQTMQKYFQQHFPLAHMIGTTTDGTIKNDSVYTQKNVVSFTLFDHTEIQSILIKHSKEEDSYQSGEFLATQLIKKNTKVIISFADGMHTNGEEFVNGIKTVADNVILSGGMAGDNGKFENTYVFTMDSYTSSGCVGVSLSSDVLQASTSYTFDWMPIGKSMKVTKSIKNRVYEIDNMSAVDIYAKYMGDELAKALPQIGVKFPLVFEIDNVLVGRAVLSKHNDGSLIFAGNVSEGTNVRFGVGNMENILKNSDYHAKQFLNTMQNKSEALFVYSCMARRRFMKQYISGDLQALSIINKCAGFFTYGEFFCSKNKMELLNETMTLLSLSESKEKPIKSTSALVTEFQSFGIDTQHVLAHLANTVSQELEEFNNSLSQKIEEKTIEIYTQAYYDRLTSLPNRLSLIDRLEDSLEKIIVLINIDDFASINDFYGFDTGDMVLLKFANALHLISVKMHAEVFKLPADEFALIMPCGDDTLKNKVEKCINEIKALDFFTETGEKVHISVTVGVAKVNEAKTGLINADMALKFATKSKLTYAIFKDNLALKEQHEFNIKMANEIKHAIHNDNIFPYYQPIFDSDGVNIEKYEALVRLRSSTGEILSPFDFLEISHTIKLYSHITQIMIEKTFKHFKENPFDFTINLSFSDILDKSTQMYLFDQINKYDIASQLTIEILETQEHSEINIVNNFIDNIYALGAKIAIDDFGSGYANFEHMTKMRSDIMKIDGSLIKNIDKDPNALLIVETIILFAKKLDRKVVAEYVHSQEVYDILKRLNVDYLQGYYLGEPSSSLVQ